MQALLSAASGRAVAVLLQRGAHAGAGARGASLGHPLSSTAALPARSQVFQSHTAWPERQCTSAVHAALLISCSATGVARRGEGSAASWSSAAKHGAVRGVSTLWPLTAAADSAVSARSAAVAGVLASAKTSAAATSATLSARTASQRLTLAAVPLCPAVPLCQTARLFATLHTQEPGGQDDGSALGPNKQVLYRGRWMRPFRLLVRLKVFQLAGVAALAIPINTFLTTGSFGYLQAVMAGSLLVGCGVASTSLWYLSRRYIGELALLAPGAAAAPAAGAAGKQQPAPRAPGRPVQQAGGTAPGSQGTQPAGGQLAAPSGQGGGGGRQLVCFSVLDFWGNREDNCVDVAAIVPPLQGKAPALASALARQPLLGVEVANDRQYLLSLRHGHVLDRARLRQLLEGSLPDAA